MSENCMPMAHAYGTWVDVTASYKVLRCVVGPDHTSGRSIRGALRSRDASTVHSTKRHRCRKLDRLRRQIQFELAGADQAHHVGGRVAVGSDAALELAKLQRLLVEQSPQDALAQRGGDTMIIVEPDKLGICVAGLATES